MSGEERVDGLSGFSKKATSGFRVVSYVSYYYVRTIVPTPSTKDVHKKKQPPLFFTAAALW